MAMQPIASLILPEQRLPERFTAAVRLAVRKGRPVAVLALGLALVPLPPQGAFGQINSQQEQQQREQQQRDQQQREQQQREEQQRQQEQRDQQQREQQQREQQQREEQQRQQERDQQQREQQQREQQQREEQQRQQEQRDQQQREQQQREQQQREEQQRGQQQRDQQQRDQAQREQQQRDQQQREQQQREQQQREAQEQQQQQRDQELKAQQQREQRDQQQRTSDFPVPSSKPGAEVSHATAKTPAADGKRSTSDIQTAATERRPDTSLPIKPAPQPIAPKPVPEVAKKTCKDGPCQPCSSTQSKDKKDGPCAPEAAAKNVAPAVPKAAGPQTCAAGQVWNGNQCLIVGGQPCTPGQIGFGSCQVECATAFTAAQGYIDLLRNARQQKDEACLKDQTSTECSQAELDYNARISEYRNYLGSVPIGCQSTLPDPSAI